MKNEKRNAVNPKTQESVEQQDEIFDPDDNLFCTPEGQSLSVCHPSGFKSQKSANKRKKESFDEF